MPLPSLTSEFSTHIVFDFFGEQAQHMGDRDLDDEPPCRVEVSADCVD